MKPDPKPDQWESIHALWNELAEFPAAEIDSALFHLMTALCRRLGADNAVWVGSAKVVTGAAARLDPQLGWRGVAVRHLHETPLARARTAEAIRGQVRDPGMTTVALAAGVGSFRVHRLHDGFVDIAAFKETAHYRIIYRDAGIVDRMFIGVPVNRSVESFFLIDRYGEKALFSAQEEAWTRSLMGGLKRFSRDLMLSHGLLLATTPLTPAERRITRLLLTDRSEKEIAEAMGQAPATTHKYITEILRKLGVKGRAGLMALWLS